LCGGGDQGGFGENLACSKPARKVFQLGFSGICRRTDGISEVRSMEGDKAHAGMSRQQQIPSTSGYINEEKLAGKQTD
jgi:hypothetical protein